MAKRFVSVFVLLETCFSLIYRVRPRPLIRQQAVAMAMFLLFLLLVPLMVFTVSMPMLAFSLLQHTPLGRRFAARGRRRDRTERWRNRGGEGPRAS